MRISVRKEKSTQMLYVMAGACKRLMANHRSHTGEDYPLMRVRVCMYEYKIIITNASLRGVDGRVAFFVSRRTH
jgi:hypothetical protein